MTAAFDVAFMSIWGAAALAPSVWSTITLICATCRTCSPKLRWAGVALNPYLSSGIAAAILARVSFCWAQSFTKSPLSDAVWAVGRAVVRAAARANKANPRNTRIMSKPPRTIRNLRDYKAYTGGQGFDANLSFLRAVRLA